MDLLDTYLKMAPSGRNGRFVKTGQAARVAGVSRRTIQAWVEYGYVEAVRIGHQYQVDLHSLRDYLRETSSR